MIATVVVLVTLWLLCLVTGLDKTISNLIFALRMRFQNERSIGFLVARSISSPATYLDWEYDYEPDPGEIKNVKVGVVIYKLSRPCPLMQYEGKRIELNSLECRAIKMALEHRRLMLKSDNQVKQIEGQKEAIVSLASKFVEVYESPNDGFPELPPWFDHPAVLEASGFIEATADNEFQLLRHHSKAAEIDQQPIRKTKKIKKIA